MASILANPRYTGRQVWNRQASDAQRTSTGERVDLVRWLPPSEWVISTRPAHPALISEADFVAVQGIRAVRPAADGGRRVYRLAGLLACGVCGRRMDAHWANNRPGYRCRHGRTSASPRAGAGQDRDRFVYVREDELLSDLAAMFQQGKAVVVPEQIPDLLRARKITITCGRTRRSLTPS